MSNALFCIGEPLAELNLAGPACGADAEPRTGEAVLGFGGDAANTAVMAASCGVRARLVGRVGDDGLGRRLLAFLAGRGVDVAAVVVDPTAPTGLYVSELQPDGSHRFDYHRRGSAGSRLCADDVPLETIGPDDVVFASGITAAISATAADAVAEAVRVARARGALVAFSVNHRPALAPDPHGLLAHARAADIVFASEADAAAVAGTSDPGAFRELLGDAAELVFSRGPLGALVASADGVVACEAPEVDVADTVGAGDALAGTYLAARAAGTGIRRALECGVRAAALACRRRGAAGSYPTADELAPIAGTTAP